MKIIITGGHISPALSIIDKLINHVEIFFVGRKYVFEGDKAESFEYKICTKELKIPFFSINAGRLQRKFTRHTIPSIIKFPIGIIHGIIIIQKIKPDVVLTFGGYVGLTVSIAAFLLGVPVVMHEQTQKAGLSNKIIALFAKKVCISFESSSEYFPKNKTVLTGNPIRDEIYEVKKTFEVPKGFKIIYITGGSSGAHFINERILEILDKLLEKFVVIHQTGESKLFNDFDKLQKFYDTLPPRFRERYILRKFIFPSEIGWIFRNADLVISRSGINTTYEIMALSKLSLMIPLFYGQSNEQLDNARLIKKNGIGEYLEEKDINEEVLFKKIIYMLDNEKIYKAKMNEVKKYIIPNASQKIIDVLELIYEEKKRDKF